ncbi:MAG: NAD-binding protein [Nitrospinae bacterium]|nr:NAD-binding protein [Nitrospinota bacterium]
MIGGGILGLEAARGLKVSWLQVTVVEYFSRLLPRQLDKKGAKFYRG